MKKKLFHRNLMRDTLRYTDVDKRKLHKELVRCAKHLGDEFSNKTSDLAGAFTWHDSPQGHNCWSNAYNWDARR